MGVPVVPMAVVVMAGPVVTGPVMTGMMFGVRTHRSIPIR